MKTASLPFDARPVRSLKRSRWRLSAGTSLLIIACSALVVLGLAAALDARFILSQELRMALRVVVLSAAPLALITWWWRTRRAHTEETTVRLMEASAPSLGQKLRTAREVAKRRHSGDAESTGMARALLSDAETCLKSGAWSHLAPRGRFIRWLLMAGAVVAAIAFVAGRWPDFRFALQRVISPADAPTYTTVQWTAVPGIFDDHHPPRLAVQLSGRTASPVLKVRETGAATWQELPLTALSDGHTHDTILTGRTNSFEACVVAGDGGSDIQTVRYRPIPRLTDAAVTVTLPSYTGREPERRNGGDVRALEGSRLDWEFVFNTPPTRVQWQISTPSGVEILPLQTDGPNAKVSWVAPAGKFPATLTVMDDDGSTIDSWKYEIAGEVDALPRVEILEPAKDTEATPVTELPVRIRVRDDYGVAELGLILEAAGEKFWTMEKTIDTRDQMDVTEMTRAMLEQVPLTIRDNVRVYAYGLDHKPRGGPRAVSPMRAIDIREFKKRSIYLGKVPGGGPPIDPKQVMKISQLITMQRAVVSDAHLANEQSHGVAAGSMQPQCLAIREKENKTIAATQTVIEDWKSEPTIPRDDQMLLDTAFAQMNETVAFLSRSSVDKGFTSADRALTSLLQLRKHLLRLIMESDKPCDCDQPCENDEMKKLSGLAKEAQRLANEEKGVREQIEPGKQDGPKASVEASRRQQEVAVADAGELYAAIVSHPQKNDSMLRLMGQAETSMKQADTDIHAADPLNAREPLSNAEQQLHDVADFILSMETKKLADTLKQMASKAKQDAKETAKAEGKPGAEPKPGTAPGDGSGKGGPPKDTAGDKEAQKAMEKSARNTALTDEILKALAQNAGEKPSDEAAKEGDKPGNQRDTLTGEEIAKLREQLGTEALANDLKKLAEGKDKGEGKGEGKGDGEGTCAEASRRLDDLAKALIEQARKLESSRLARLAAVKSQAKSLREQITKETKKRELSAEDRLLVRLREQGLPVGTTVSVGGKKLQIPAEGDEGQKPGDGQKPGPGKGENNNGGGFGPAMTRFVSDADRLNDEPITEWTKQLETVVPQMAVQPLTEIEKRLDELIAALPGGGEEKVQANRVPEANRREVEDYFKNLSDDFGGDLN